MSQIFRFGLVGCGAISGAHVRALEELAGRGELVAVADIRPEAAHALAEKTRTRAFESIEAMLTWGEFDAVDLFTPPNVHADGAVTAMRAGKDVIVEKPADVSVVATARSSRPLGRWGGRRR